MKIPICPICNSVENSLLFSLTSHEVAAHLFPDNTNKTSEIVPIIEQIWENKHVDFLVCRNCSFGFANPFKAGTSAFYSALYYSDFEYPIQKWEYNKTFQVLKSLLNSGQEYKLLEIGAGNGSFLSHLIEDDLFKKENLYATEYSTAAVTAIRSKGFNCTNKNIIQLRDTEGLPQFNIVCMFQVLEHLDNLDAVFQSINALSTPNADLFIAVPNSKLRNYLDKYSVIYDIPPVHIGKHTLKSFQFLGKKNNWQVVSYAFEPMSLNSKIRKFLFERYWNNHSAIKVEKYRNPRIKKIFRYSLMFWLCIRYAIVFLYLSRNDFGTSFWIHMKKAA